ncbi:hypothetical protein [Pseudoalteromonas spongiae]|uniref:hypothetical protein n=1 Tax=Pseudoalteromonas spongiae TaxID=298657 RepID=UPI00026CB3A0|nr:hypothetical protein [Pseudoalteromonas spongiae]ATC98479.1 hypothetical protein PSPO_a1392 [Pseudoalteromonas spongiae UST010723-006]
MWSWIMIVLGLVASGYFTDVYSESNLQAIVCPIIFVILIITTLIKASLLSSGLSNSRSGTHGTSFSGGGFLSGDSGSNGGDCSGGGGDC